MTWTRGGDTAATYPDLMQVHGFHGADERTVNELFGFLMRCAFQCAAHLTDYVIDAGTAYMMGGARTEALIALGVQAGLLTPVEDPLVKKWTLRADPEFIHIPTRREVEWARQQRKDGSDPRLWTAVVKRDGDNCRWCGIGVQWLGAKTSRSGELDHLKPGEAGTPETMVVACRGCNRARGGDVDVWDSSHALLAVPAHPLYGTHSAKKLSNNGYPTTANNRSDQAPAHAAAADPAPTSVRPAAPGPERPRPTKGTARTTPTSDPLRPDTWKPPAGTPREVDEKSVPRSTETGSPGSGRDGSGLVSRPTTSPADHDDAPPTPSPRPRSRRRGRRGNRKSQPGGTA